MAAQDKLCVALDVDSLQKATALAEILKNYVGMFKVGLQLFSSEGPKVVEAIRIIGGKIFLDVKYHDIPNTVENAVRVITSLGVSMFNVHTTGGYDMMARTVEAVNNEVERLKIARPKIIGVTVLTSINDFILNSELRVSISLIDYVVHLAKMAKRAGLDGVVASPKETVLLRESLGPDFIIITPGIRPSWSASPDDQKRITTPLEAVKNGSSYIVVGRPIISADSPVEAAKKIVDEINFS